MIAFAVEIKLSVWKGASCRPFFLTLAAVAGFAAAQADNAHPVAFPRESGPRLFRARAEQRRVAACLSMVVMSALPPLAHVFLALWHDFPVVGGMFSCCSRDVFLL